MKRKRIDLRSDTVTKPGKEMLQAMMDAEVGDDVFGDDPTVNALQDKVAAMFGMESALFCPSGTMANQISLRILTQPQEEVICDKRSHIYLYEGGGLAYNSMLSPKLLDGDRGRITSAMVEANINEDDIHFPKTSLVSLENTMNKGGGSIYDIEEIKKIREVCNKNGLKMHLDGARLFNALVETAEDPSLYGALFDTVSVCFSKGLGAPVGSAIVSSSANIKAAKRIRQVFGGAMQQTGYLAAACIYALDHQIDRLREDHIRARALGESIEECPLIEEVLPVETNIVIATLKRESPAQFLGKLSNHSILAVPFGSDAVRFVTHLHFSDDDLMEVRNILKKLS